MSDEARAALLAFVVWALQWGALWYLSDHVIGSMFDLVGKLS